MKLLLFTIIVCFVATVAPETARAFCGGWDAPVALGFDGGSWTDRWLALTVLLASVGGFMAFAVKRFLAAQAMPQNEA